LNSSGGTQAKATDLTDRVVFADCFEQGDINGTYAVDSGSGFRLWASLGLGVAVSRFDQRSPVTVNARIPHPSSLTVPEPSTVSQR